MGTYSDYEQRLLDQQTGEEMDRLAQQRERREARDTIATAPVGPAHVFADADNNGLNARVLPAALTSNKQVEQLISEYQLAIDVRSHHTPLGRIDRIKQRCEETIAALRELQGRRERDSQPHHGASKTESLADLLREARRDWITDTEWVGDHYGGVMQPRGEAVRAFGARIDAALQGETPDELTRLRDEVRKLRWRANRAEDFLCGYDSAPSTAKYVLNGGYDHELRAQKTSEHSFDANGSPG